MKSAAAARRSTPGGATRFHGGTGMMGRRLLGCLAGLLCLTTLPAGAQGPNDDGLEKLGATLKPLLIGALPPVLYEKEQDWGRQVKTRLSRSPRNDGVWRKLRVTAQDPQRHLELRLTDLRNIGPDTQTFKVFLAFQAGIDYEQQNWERGLRLLSSSAEARVRLKLTLECESTFRLEPTDKLLPDLVFRLRIVKAELSYDNLVFEHLAGIGGSGARLMGEALRSSLKQWKPSLERELLNRANAAIVRAADTREVRLGLGGLVRQKK
jgi:hypothetical protein